MPGHQISVVSPSAMDFTQRGALIHPSLSVMCESKPNALPISTMTRVESGVFASIAISMNTSVPPPVIPDDVLPTTLTVWDSVCTPAVSNPVGNNSPRLTRSVSVTWSDSIVAPSWNENTESVGKSSCIRMGMWSVAPGRTVVSGSEIIMGVAEARMAVTAKRVSSIPMSWHAKRTMCSPFSITPLRAYVVNVRVCVSTYTL